MRREETLPHPFWRSQASILPSGDREMVPQKERHSWGPPVGHYLPLGGQELEHSEPVELVGPGLANPHHDIKKQQVS